MAEVTTRRLLGWINNNLTTVRKLVRFAGRCRGQWGSGQYKQWLSWPRTTLHGRSAAVARLPTSTAGTARFPWSSRGVHVGCALCSSNVADRPCGARRLLQPTFGFRLRRLGDAFWSVVLLAGRVSDASLASTAARITRRWSGPRRRYSSLSVERRACAAAAAQRQFVMQRQHALILLILLAPGCVPAKYVEVPALRGRVIDAEGRPVRDATVHVASESGSGMTATIISRSDGTFSRAEQSKFFLQLQALMVFCEPIPSQLLQTGGRLRRHESAVACAGGSCGSMTCQRIEISEIWWSDRGGPPQLHNQPL